MSPANSQFEDWQGTFDYSSHVFYILKIPLTYRSFCAIFLVAELLI
jgi:hypothetical protein